MTSKRKAGEQRVRVVPGSETARKERQGPRPRTEPIEDNVKALLEIMHHIAQAVQIEPIFDVRFVDLGKGKSNV